MKADHQKVLRQINIAKGQLNGIVKMIDEDAYCLDVSNQLLATIAILKSVNRDVLAAHFEHCVRESINDPKAIEEKLNELEKTLDRLTK